MIALLTPSPILIDMPEIGTQTTGEEAALIGAAPMASESGQRVGVRHIKGGRPALRAALRS